MMLSTEMVSPTKASSPTLSTPPPLTPRFTILAILPDASTINSGDLPERMSTSELKAMSGVLASVLTGSSDPSTASERKLVSLGVVTEMSLPLRALT